MVLNLLWYTILCGCTLGFAIVGEVQQHEFGKTVEELSLVECVSWPKQTTGLLGVLCIVYFASGPVVHGAYTLWKFFESAHVHPGVDPPDDH